MTSRQPSAQSHPAATTAPREQKVTVQITAAAAPLFVAALGVRWRDLDAFNHVNNSNYLTYLEEARLQWLQQIKGLWFDEHAMPVLAASELNYRAPTAWPAQLHIELRCTRLGNSSLTISHRIIDASDAGLLYCDGHVVMVWMDPANGKAVSLPSSIREAVGNVVA